MLNKAFSGGVSMSFLLAACLVTSGCVYERSLGGEGGDGGHETGGNPADGCGSGDGGYSAVGGGPYTTPGAGGHEVGGGPATNPGAGGYAEGGGPATNPGTGGYAEGGGPATNPGTGGYEEGGGRPAGEGGFGGGTETGEGGFGGGEECVSCSEFITTDPGGSWCEGSAQLYDVLVDCACEGACADACGDTLCRNNPEGTPACKECILSTSEGCGVEYLNCANDL